MSQRKKQQRSGKVKSGGARHPPVVGSRPRGPCVPLSPVVREQHVPPPPAMDARAARDWFSGVRVQSEEGFPAVPPLEPGFFAYLREMPSLTDRVNLELTDLAHRCAAEVAAAVEGISVLASHLTELADQLAPDVAALFRHGSEAILELSGCVAAVHDIMACQVLIQRNVWLSLSTLSAREQEHLLSGPISPHGLFGPRLEEKIRLDQQVKLHNL